MGAKKDTLLIALYMGAKEPTLLIALYNVIYSQIMGAKKAEFTCGLIEMMDTSCIYSKMVGTSCIYSQIMGARKATLLGASS